jgi:hypothetical protein
MWSCNRITAVAQNHQLPVSLLPATTSTKPLNEMIGNSQTDRKTMVEGTIVFKNGEFYQNNATLPTILLYLISETTSQVERQKKDL